MTRTDHRGADETAWAVGLFSATLPAAVFRCDLVDPKEKILDFPAYALLKFFEQLTFACWGQRGSNQW